MPLPAKYDPTDREAFWRDFWADNKTYTFKSNSSKPIYAVDTPPPYVSADHLHPGHIMSYSQAEFIVRYKRMQGFEVFYPMGFDDNGLPTERHVEKKYKIKNKDSISRSEFIQLCLAETAKGAENYRNLWTLLGISVDWENTYSTINPTAQRVAQWSFIDLYHKGILSRQEQPIMWDISFQTALAQTDLEDSEQEAVLYDIEFSAEDKTPLIISTTRPELIPACVALFYHPDDTRYQHLQGQKAIIPIAGHQVPILTDETVDPEFGTGLMMVCTWGDAEDIAKWRKYTLDTRILITKKGLITDLGGAYAGIHISKLRAVIIRDLKELNKVKGEKQITHTVQVSERSGTPIEFIQTKQWFIHLTEHKDALLAQGKKLQWYPKRMFSIYQDWVSSLKWDWCISRQRYYGVPIPVWYHRDTGEIILPEVSELPVDPTEYTPQGYNPEDLIPETDVLDTWMTSSVSPLIGASLLDPEADLATIVNSPVYPSSLRPQAFEIIRTWLFYTVAKSWFHHKTLPFQDVMISGHGLDSQGRKISKRLGNYTPPEQIITQYGSDALRFWATGTTLGENIRYNEEEVKKGKKTVTKLFNAARFVEMHLKDFDSTYTPDDLEPIDQWILGELQETISRATQGFESYEYFKARTVIDTFFWSSFTDNYLELIKYRLYDETKEGQDSRKTAQYTLYQVLLGIIKLYAPILPFITEEIYQGIFRETEEAISIHVASWPQVQEDYQLDKGSQEVFSALLALVEAARGYKSRQGISLGKEIDFFEYPGPEYLEQYIPFLQKALRIKRITVTQS